MEKIFVGFFHILAQFPIATSERELDFCHQKLNIQVSPQVPERLKTKDLRKSRHFNETPDGDVLDQPPKKQYLTLVLLKLKKSSVNYSRETSMLLSLSSVSCNLYVPL